MVQKLPFVALVFLCVLRQAPLFAQAGQGEGYTYRIDTAADFEKFSGPEQFLPNVERSGKFLSPAADDPRLLPTVYQNVNLYQFHFDFLRAEFADRFPGIDTEEYLNLIERRSTRNYFAGILYRFKGNPDPKYGFDIFTVAGNTDELPIQGEIRWVYNRLKESFGLTPLEYSPRRTDAIKNSQTWIDFDVPINFAFGGGLPDYIPYTKAVNYGRVKILNPQQFEEANERGAFGWQDILILDEAPSDIEGVIAGVITGEIQGELGHLAIRTARRGTPNAYVRNPAQAFAAFEGKLVRLSIEPLGYKIEEGTLADAEAWWAAHRPKLGEIPEVDADYERLDAAWEAPIDGSVRLITRYGGKGSNFARLYQLLENPRNKVPGFLIPFHYYV